MDAVGLFNRGDSGGTGRGALCGPVGPSPDSGARRGAAVLSLAPSLFGLGGYLAGLAVLTPGYQLFLAANNTAVMTSAPSAHRGAAAGALTLSRNLGFILGASALGAMFTATARDISGNEEASLGAAAVIALIALGVGLISRGRSPERGVKLDDFPIQHGRDGDPDRVGEQKH